MPNEFKLLTEKYTQIFKEYDQNYTESNVNRIFELDTKKKELNFLINY